MKLPVFSEAGVIDEQINFDSLVAGEGKNLFRSGGIGQVSREYLRLYFVSRGQPLRECVEAIFATRREHEICSVARQFFSKGHANPRASTRHKRPFTQPLASHHSSANQQISKNVHSTDWQ